MLDTNLAERIANNRRALEDAYRRKLADTPLQMSPGTQIAPRGNGIYFGDIDRFGYSPLESQDTMHFTDGYTRQGIMNKFRQQDLDTLYDTVVARWNNMLGI